MSDPWAVLSHEFILNTAEDITHSAMSNLVLRRNSYINRVYELCARDTGQRYILKFYRPHRWTAEMIRDEHDFLFRLADADLPVIPPLTFNHRSLFSVGDIPLAFFLRMGGRAIDELNQDSWKKAGRLLGRMHLIGQTIRTSTRITWTPRQATASAVDFLLQGRFIPPDYLPSLKRTLNFFYQQSEPLFSREPLLLIHGDCHLGNLIHRLDEGMFIVDFDDMCMGPAVQDLWMLLPGTPGECEQQLNWFIEGYNVFRSFDRSSLQLIQYLKVMRLIHFAHWCALQSRDTHFADHFPDWGSTRYWNELIRDIQGNIFETEE